MESQKHLTNKTVLDMFTTSSDHETSKNIIQNYEAFQNCSSESLRWKIRALGRKISEMKRNHHNVDSLLAKEFIPPEKKIINTDAFPSDQQDIAARVIDSTKAVVKENRGLKRNLEEAENNLERLTGEVDVLDRKLAISIGILSYYQKKHKIATEAMNTEQKDHAMTKKNTELWKEKYTQQAAIFDQLGKDYSKLKDKMSKYNTRNVNKREKRSKSKIDQLKNENKECTSLLSEAKDLLTEKELELETNALEANMQILQLKESKVHLQKKVSYLKRREKTSHKSSISDAQLVCNDLEIERLREKISECQQEMEHLHSVNEIMQSDMISTFENGKYVSELRQTVMTLATECNVSLNKMNSVIETVLKNLTGNIPERLPSHAILCRILNEAKFVAQAQVGEAIINQSDILNQHGSCLHSDGTTKFHREYEGFQVTLPNGRVMSMGMTEVASQSADGCMDAFSHVIAECVQALNSVQDETDVNTKAKLITAITSTMTDQGPANPKFFSMLEAIKVELLPTVFENWEAFADETKSHLGEMAHFFCKLHLLANFSSECSKLMQTFESNTTTGRNPFSFSSEACGTFRLLNACSKAFHPRGSDKSGVAGHWKSFLSEQGKKNSIINLEHERLNTIFCQGGAAYYHAEQITEFLASWPDQNDLLKCIFFDIREKVYLAGARALGIIDKVITGPFWRLIESTPNILDLNNDLSKLQIKLQQWSEDASELMEGHCQLFENIEMNRDPIFEKLFEETDDVQMDTLSRIALEICCHALLLILERQAKDQLPGGKYCNPDDSFKVMAENVKGTNMASERDFAQLDWLIRIKPAATLLSLEAVILWTNNKTTKWLETMDDSKREKILDEARRMAPTVTKMFKEREQIIAQRKIEKLHQKQREKDQKREKQIKKKTQLTNTVMALGGLWQHTSEIDEKLQTIKTLKDKMEAVWAQISFHKELLRSNGRKEVFQKSVRGKAFTLLEMIANLKEIINLNKLSDNVTEDEPTLTYMDHDEVVQNIKNTKDMLMKKLSAARAKRVADSQIRILPELLDMPQSLVGKMVKHKCRNPGEAAEWFMGTVTGIAKETQNPLKTKYVIIYDEDADTEWEFTLLTDLKKGDLIIL